MGGILIEDEDSEYSMFVLDPKEAAKRKQMSRKKRLDELKEILWAETLDESKEK